MSNSHGIKENFETLQDLSITMSQSIEQFEQQQSELEKDNKRLNDNNEMLLEMTKKQRLMVGTSDQSKGTTSSEDITNKYRVSIYKKLDELKKNMLQNQTPFPDDFDFDEKNAKDMFKLRVQIHSILEENQLLKDQILHFQNLHDRVMAEIRLQNVKNCDIQTANDQKQGIRTLCASPTTTVSLDEEDDLQPLQVNVIDSDVDELKNK